MTDDGGKNKNEEEKCRLPLGEGSHYKIIEWLLWIMTKLMGQYENHFWDLYLDQKILKSHGDIRAML